jgi:ribonuclease P/MRP protein subunit RPP1
MQAFDLHVHSAFSGGESSLEQLASTAKLLGYKGICFAEYFEGENQLKKLKEEIEKVKQKVGIEIFLGFEARTVKELKFLSKIRRKFDILLARGGDLKLNREACETPEVDILTHPEYERLDSGLDHVSAKLAAKNNVAIEVNFREILISSKATRSKILANIQNNIKLAKKFKAPIILCSGALSHFELKDPYVMVSFATQLGLELKEAKEAISKIPEKIIKQALERKSEKWILPGVKIVK